MMAPNISRELALKISCLQDKDRQWILQRLSPQEREVLAPLMDEINTLGLNRDPSIIDNVMKSIKGNADTTIASSALKNVRDIQHLDVFWQSLLIGCLEKRDRAFAKRKYGLNIDDADIVENTPPALQKTLIHLMSQH